MLHVADLDARSSKRQAENSLKYVVRNGDILCIARPRLTGLTKLRTTAEALTEPYSSGTRDRRARLPASHDFRRHPVSTVKLGYTRVDQTEPNKARNQELDHVRGAPVSFHFSLQ